MVEKKKIVNTTTTRVGCARATDGRRTSRPHSGNTPILTHPILMVFRSCSSCGGRPSVIVSAADARRRAPCVQCVCLCVCVCVPFASKPPAFASRNEIRHLSRRRRKGPRPPSCFPVMIWADRAIMLCVTCDFGELLNKLRSVSDENSYGAFSETRQGCAAKARANSSKVIAITFFFFLLANRRNKLLLCFNARPEKDDETTPVRGFSNGNRPGA